jgi:preprotein translocase subunit SecG
MSMLLLADLKGALLGWLMGFLSLFLILLILVQRGKGGGLTGALGGPGGQSAFGSKAGDTFTVITIVVASIWGFTCAFTMWLLGTHAPPEVTQKTTVTAGPGDDVDEEPPTGIVIPKSTGPAGLSGLGEASSETPSMELVPKQPADQPATETPGDEPETTDDEAATTPPADATTPAAESETPPAAESETPPAAETETPPPAAETETPPAADSETPPASESETPPAAESESPASETDPESSEK